MNTYKRHRFPPDIISYAVWLYYRFNLSHRDIEDLLAERGITVWMFQVGIDCATVCDFNATDVGVDPETME
jgi:putative transposase